jgi:hypothetical protein
MLPSECQAQGKLLQHHWQARVISPTPFRPRSANGRVGAPVSYNTLHLKLLTYSCTRTNTYRIVPNCPNAGASPVSYAARAARRSAPCGEPWSASMFHLRPCPRYDTPPVTEQALALNAIAITATALAPCMARGGPFGATLPFFHVPSS